MDHASVQHVEPAATDLEPQGDGKHAATPPAVRYNPDAPSEEWGWHGSWRVFAARGSTFLLGLGVFMLFMLNFTEHQSHVENYYFNGLALIGLIWIVMRVRSGRKMRQRKAGSHHDETPPRH